jgi:Flp pilus assembly protein TadG
MSWRLDASGSVAVATIVFLPLLVVVVAGVIQLGALRMDAARAKAAADLAAVVGVNDQDEGELARSGRLRLASDAVSVARSYFAANLAAMGSSLAQDASTIAALADVAAFPDAPAIDQRTGARYDRPTVRIWADVPLRTPLFGPLLGPGITVVTVRATGSAR